MKELIPRLEKSVARMRLQVERFNSEDPPCVQAAEDIFKVQVMRMRFKTLCIQDRPASQGFEEETHDLVIAASVSCFQPYNDAEVLSKFSSLGASRNKQ